MSVFLSQLCILKRGSLISAESFVRKPLRWAERTGRITDRLPSKFSVPEQNWKVSVNVFMVPLYWFICFCFVAGHTPGLVTPILSRRSTKRQSSFLIRVWQSIAHLKSSRNASRSLRFLVKDSHQYPLVHLSFSVWLWCPGHISIELRIVFCFKKKYEYPEVYFFFKYCPIIQ